MTMIQHEFTIINSALLMLGIFQPPASSPGSPPILTSLSHRQAAQTESQKLAFTP